MQTFVRKQSPEQSQPWPCNPAEGPVLYPLTSSKAPCKKGFPQSDVALVRREAGLASFPFGSEKEFSVKRYNTIKMRLGQAPHWSRLLGSSNFYPPFVLRWRYLCGISNQSACLNTIHFNSEKLFQIFLERNEWTQYFRLRIWYLKWLSWSFWSWDF